MRFYSLSLCLPYGSQTSSSFFYSPTFVTGFFVLTNYSSVWFGPVWNYHYFLLPAMPSSAFCILGSLIVKEWISSVIRFDFLRSDLYMSFSSSDDAVLSVTCSRSKIFDLICILSTFEVYYLIMLRANICYLTKWTKSSSPVALLKPNLVSSSLQHFFFIFSFRLKILVVINNASSLSHEKWHA